MKQLFFLLLLFVPLQAQDQRRPDAEPQSLLATLPQEIRAQAQVVLEGESEEKRASAAGTMARTSPEPAVDFLLSVLRHDRSVAVRRAILHHLGRYPDPRVVSALKESALSEKETDLAALALQRLGGLASLELQKLAEKRMASMPASDQETLKLAEEQERYWCLARNVILPAWLRTPPPVFRVSAKSAIRIMAFGDYGDGGADQRRVAKAMLKYQRQNPVDFGITLGDNFQDQGADSPEDARWIPRWRDLYPALKIRFYPTLGNHDWAAPSGPAAAVLYSQKDPYWTMPATYYTFEAGPVQFFALDTNALSEAQLRWLDTALTKSRARWKVVYGHHPIFSSGSHADTPALIERLLPLLKGRASAYLCGHDHHMEHLKSDGMDFFICGTGGHSLRPATGGGDRSVFAQSTYGFLIISAKTDSLMLEFLDESLRTVYSYALE